MFSFIILCFLAGSIGAILQGMLGIGTGIIIVPLLAYLLPQYGINKNLSMHIALATSMAAIAVNSITVLINHQRLGNIRWPLFYKIISFSMLGSCIGALIASVTGGTYLQIFFGFFLLFIAIYMLFKRQASEMVDNIPHLSLSKIATGGFSIGFIASIVGSGGGVLMVPFLRHLNLKMRYAVGTSTLIGFPVALVGTMTYVIAGYSALPDNNAIVGYVHWPALLAISFAGILFAPIGVKLSTTSRSNLLQILFSCIMMFVALKMIGSK